MTIYAIGDLHLSGGGAKPMDIFGKQWENHFERICERWLALVTPADVVLIPGDISWAMQFEDAAKDLASIAALPGKKILLRGNHDYWWNSISRLRASLPADMYALQNDALVLDQLVVCGTRGWDFPVDTYPMAEQDLKIYRRELIRLEMTLQNAQKSGLPILAMMHFPPLLAERRDTAYTALLERFGVKLCVYGHLHGAGIQNGFDGLHQQVAYRLVSCDAIAFTPVKVWEGDQSLVVG